MYRQRRRAKSFLGQQKFPGASGAEYACVTSNTCGKVGLVAPALPPLSPSCHPWNVLAIIAIIVAIIAIIAIITIAMMHHRHHCNRHLYLFSTFLCWYWSHIYKILENVFSFHFLAPNCKRFPVLITKAKKLKLLPFTAQVLVKHIHSPQMEKMQSQDACGPL